MLFDRTTQEAAVKNTEPFHYLATGEEAQSVSPDRGDPLDWNARTNPASARIENREKEAFERGVLEGRTRAKAEFDKQADAARAAIANAVAAFKSQRESYFGRVEPEIVQLSLAIARKILHREVQMDPLLLTGLVHVALDKLESGTRVRLRANPADIHSWSEYFARPDSRQPCPELIGDPELKPGECALEGDMGSTQISVETQLKEIEQGFFDLLEQRPRMD
jgi:flagellar assembly protein FliH